MHNNWVFLYCLEICLKLISSLSEIASLSYIALHRYGITHFSTYNKPG